MRAVAKELGVSEGAIYLWNKIPAFEKALEDALFQLEKATLTELRQSGPDAVLTARSLLSAESEMARLGAAKLILDYNDRMIARRRDRANMERLEAEIEALQMRMEALGIPDYEAAMRRMRPPVDITVASAMSEVGEGGVEGWLEQDEDWVEQVQELPS